MRGAPQVGFSAAMRKIKARISLLTGFRPPGLCTPEMSRQYRRNPRAMPPNHGSGCNQNQRLFPANPKPSQHDPEQLVQSAESPARSPCAQSQELLAEGQVFEDEILSRTEGTDNPADEVSEPRDHGQNRIETSLHQPLATRSFSECTRF